MQTQFFLRTADADVGRYLKMFSLLPMGVIDEVMMAHEVGFLGLASLPVLTSVSAHLRSAGPSAC